jgi:transposase
MISRLERRAAADLEAPVQAIREHIRRAPSAHIDETSWREGRAKVWLWAAVAKSATVFEIARSRGADVARGLLGVCPSIAFGP